MASIGVATLKFLPGPKVAVLHTPRFKRIGQDIKVDLTDIGEDGNMVS